ncbi:hypothetical protein [Parabacteroides sp. PF5-9]|uniref:hypothetical protein n=1 Tax=Parabacteroides sp. PF5-9 TaxID=1742404 RepID=UPI0024768F8D|nr:hypothetical protein [Parabacteroides sp. PF5-9]MDH6358476.1 hypothetical protein [Parabacteroides sp. PF5-9]
MEPNKENTQKISRKRFLQVCGSVVAGGTILGVSGTLLRKMFIIPEGILQTNASGNGGRLTARQEFASPYKLVSSFNVPDQIEGFEIYGEKLVVAASNNIYIYDRFGTLLNNFAVASRIRDIAVFDDRIYLLFPSRIEAYDLEGAYLLDWEACSEESDYCSFTVTGDYVFATDAANKNICKYTTEGNFVKFIQSPNGFIIPSYSFGITHVDGTLYCSNSGRHLIESYTLDGEYLGAFGKPGGADGLFCGCCNPVHLAYTSTGEIITSEKGKPRISCYSPDGQFRSVLLDSKMLGGGNMAYDVKVTDDKLFVTGQRMISTFQYDKVLAANTACSGCSVNCPLREGITI